LKHHRVLTIAGHLGAIGGSEVAQESIMEGLATLGWTVELLYAERGDLWPKWNQLATYTRRIRASWPDSAVPLTSALGTLEAMALAVSRNVDVVYVHNPGDLPLARLVGTLRRIPVLVHLHLPPPYRQPSWQNLLIRSSDGVVTPSDDSAQRWIKEAGVDPGRVSVIPTGIDTKRFAPIPEVQRERQRSELAIEPGVPMILYAGRVHPTKGLDVLMEAMINLDDSVHLVICGGGADDGYAERLRSMAVGHRVSFLDRRSDIAPLMAAADLLVLPSVIPETQGLVVNEAMATGTPAIATAVGGLEASLAGFPDHLVPLGDATALAVAIRSLANWRIRDPEIGQRSRQWVLDNLSLRDSVGDISALLERMHAH
jgi:glycosyltransferase involved in cell wall biosynthesis